MKKYKRGFCVLLSAALCFGLVACGDASAQADSDSKTEVESSNTAKETLLTKDELNSYLEEVEITTENWQDYFSVEDYSYVGKDEFGEATGDESDEKILVCRENVIPVNSSSEDELVFEFTYTSTTTGLKFYDKETEEDVSDKHSITVDGVVGYSHDKETTLYASDISSVPTDNSQNVSPLYTTRERYGTSTWGDDLEEEYTSDISDFTLNRVKGTVKVSNIPDDKWNTDEEHGKYIIVNAEDDSNSNYYMFENGAVFESDSFDNIDWESGNIGGDEGLVSWQYPLENM